MLDIRLQLPDAEIFYSNLTQCFGKILILKAEIQAHLIRLHRELDLMIHSKIFIE